MRLLAGSMCWLLWASHVLTQYLGSCFPAQCASLCLGHCSRSFKSWLLDMTLWPLLRGPGFCCWTVPWPLLKGLWPWLSCVACWPLQHYLFITLFSFIRFSFISISLYVCLLYHLSLWSLASNLSAHSGVLCKEICTCGCCMLSGGLVNIPMHTQYQHIPRHTQVP